MLEVLVSPVEQTLKYILEITLTPVTE